MNKNNYKAVLIIIDPQNDFITGSMALPGAKEAMDLLSNYLQKCSIPVFQNIVITRDWHPVNHCSFITSWKLKPDATPETKLEPGHVVTHATDIYWKCTSSYRFKNETFAVWPKHCVAGTKGAEIYDPLWKSACAFLKGKEPVIIDKGCHPAIEELSAFGEYNPVGKDVIKTLLDEDYNIFYFAGLAKDFCVKNSIKDFSDKIWRLKDRIFLLNNCTVMAQPENESNVDNFLQNEHNIHYQYIQQIKHEI